MSDLARQVGARLKADGALLATAESCTGGWVAQEVTSVAGSSAWFDRGFVTYSNDAKRELLGVSPASLKRFGAVSGQVAREMAAGALARSPSDVSVALTGIAGPTGAAPGKPVGTVWFAWAQRGGPVQSRRFVFSGGRVEVRRQAIAVAIQGVIDLLR